MAIVCVFERSAKVGSNFAFRLLQEANVGPAKLPIAYDYAGGESITVLDLRHERQALPHSSVPVLFGATSICGETFREEEIRCYAEPQNNSGRYEVWVDGKPVRQNLGREHLEVFLQTEFALNLDPEAEEWNGLVDRPKGAFALSVGKQES